ncbi:MAG: heparinase II/III family protein [Prevotellaceae bacterium]|jgi:heparan-sulfate lyase|nr:heparinase II/III family protein [Prevotellaceae bacterium]
MKKIGLFLFASLMWLGSLNAQEKSANAQLLDEINFSYEGLEQVKALAEQGKVDAAAEALLQYYKHRDNEKHPDVDIHIKTVGENDRKVAEEAMEHQFFVHKGYQPSYFYGKDINWQYWPVRDNELRWQLHRMKWWLPMAKMYTVAKDEKWVKEWIYQYEDWIAKNPLVEQKKKLDYDDVSNGEIDSDENVRFAWRPLEVSHRLQLQTELFPFFISSPNFDADFLAVFLNNTVKHAEHIRSNYSKKGNHLLFEAQRLFYAGSYFPELKNAETWRKESIDILNREIHAQVYDDGFQYELDPHYHLAAINIFMKALRMAKENGMENEFPKSYTSTIQDMIMAVVNYSFPDYTNPMFSDAKLHGKEEMIGNYKDWLKVFPDNEVIRFFATKGGEGKVPSYLSHALKTSGYYTFRNAWMDHATVMVVKAGPPAFWHNQPDNGTFELYVNGRNFFPDAGSYVYAGGEEVMRLRNWFRQTMVHKTLTLNNANLDSMNSKLLLWKTSSKEDVLVYVNPSYQNLDHKRSIFFIDQKFFVIIDEAIGAATGDVGTHYQLLEGTPDVDMKNLKVTTTYNDGNNIMLQCFSPDKNVEMKMEEGWVSRAYMKRDERPAFVFETNKKDSNPVRFVTVIYPVEDSASSPKIQVGFDKNTFSDKILNLKVNVDKKTYLLKYDLP